MTFRMDREKLILCITLLGNNYQKGNFFCSRACSAVSSRIHRSGYFMEHICRNSAWYLFLLISLSEYKLNLSTGYVSFVQCLVLIYKFLWYGFALQRFSPIEIINFVQSSASFIARSILFRSIFINFFLLFYTIELVALCLVCR